MNSERPLILASVPYMNAAILTQPITRVCPRAQVVLNVPSRLTNMLLSREADAALVPTVDYLAHDELTMVGNLGIVAEGNVQSVILKCYVPLTRVRRVARDPASRTSNALAEVLFRERWQMNPVFVDVPNTHDAEVCIGDRALRSGRPAEETYDLAGQWKVMTGLPFVFAVWAARREHAEMAEMADILEAALEAGLDRAAEFAEAQARRLDLSVAHCLNYMTTTVRYRIGRKEHLGMQTFKAHIDARATS